MASWHSIVGICCLVFVCACGCNSDSASDTADNDQSPAAGDGADETKTPAALIVGTWRPDFDATVVSDEWSRWVADHPDEANPTQGAVFDWQFTSDGVFRIRQGGGSLDNRYQVVASTSDTLTVDLQELLLGTDDTRDTRVTFRFVDDNTMHRSGDAIAPGIFKRVN